MTDSNEWGNNNSYFDRAIFYEVISNMMQRFISIELYDKEIDLSDGVEILAITDEYIDFLNSNIQKIKEILEENNIDLDEKSPIDYEKNVLAAINEFCIMNTDMELAKIRKKDLDGELTQ